jgi:hypothetical protein
MSTEETLDKAKEKMAENIICEIWYSTAEKIFERVCEVTELDKEQIEALRKVALRPNDFQVRF